MITYFALRDGVEGEGRNWMQRVEEGVGVQRIYERGPLKWPQLLQVDPGCEFMGAVTKIMENS